MRLHLSARMEQQQVLAPQMILSMDILLLNSLDLENRIEKEFMENPALELAENEESSEPRDETSERDKEIAEIMDVLGEYERRFGGNDVPMRRGSDGGGDESKQEALLNHADRPPTLVEHLRAQLPFAGLDPRLQYLTQELAGNIDHRGYFIGELEEFASALCVPLERAEAALKCVHGLDPRGVGARDLRECLLLQLGDAPSVERSIVADYLDDLLENRLPRIAEQLRISIDDVQEAREFIAKLDPCPGAGFDSSRDGVAIPEMFVDEIDGVFKVRMEETLLPNLRISPACTMMLRQDGHNPQVREFIRRKLEAARWLIHAIEQRRRTLLDIAQAIVDVQNSFFVHGPGHLSALTMQAIAEQVGVHISTVSRATNGKYIETPYGVFELRRFFTGGVEREGGGIESRDNVCQLIEEIVRGEDAHHPLSDSQLAAALRGRGIEIARRTVTKYRERAGIPALKLRKKY